MSLFPSGHATRHTSAATGMPVAYPKAHSTGPDSERDIGMVSLRDYRMPCLPLTSAPVFGRNVLNMLM
jgi:membrane-associated phospholipid phosphatase